MRSYDKFYINGQWVKPIGTGSSEVINPSNGETSAAVPYGNTEDVDAAVWAGDKDKATSIARGIRAGQCAINGADPNHEAPFGGYKESGNGREFDVEELHEYCELKAMQYWVSCCVNRLST